MRSDERALLAEGIMWDYERDFMPEGMEIVDRKGLLIVEAPEGSARSAPLVEPCLIRADHPRPG